MGPINLEVRDARDLSRSIVASMKRNATRVRLGTKIPKPRGGKQEWKAELSAQGARAVGSALLLAAAQIELAESRGAGDAAGKSDGNN